MSALDNATGTVTLSRGKAKRDEPLPTSLVPGRAVPDEGTAGGAAPVRRLAARRRRRYPHLERLLRREPPLGGAPLQCLELAEQRALLDRLEGSYLVVQGPPGSGKTYRGARLITHLLAAGAEGRRHGAEPQGDPQPARRGGGGGGRGGARLPRRQVRRPLYESEHVKPGDLDDVLDPEVKLVAGTAWLFAREELDGELDTLVVDEAGQYSLADTIACGTSARAARPARRPAPARPGHAGRPSRRLRRERARARARRARDDPGGARRLPRADAADAPGRVPLRLGGVLRGPAPLDRRSARERTTSDGVGVRWLAVEHEGNRVDSEEEADAIAAEIERLLGHTFTRRGRRAAARATAT